MIVCVCNRLRDSEVRGAIAQGAGCAEDVHARCGSEVNCGCCLDTMDDMIDAARGLFCGGRQLQAAG